MPKSLAEMRTSPAVGLPERSTSICMAGKLVAQIEELEAKYDEVEDKAPSGRLNAKSPARKIAEQIDKLREEMNDHLIGIRLRAKPGYEWRAFVAAHPPVEGSTLDRNSGVSVDGVIKDLPDFIVTVNDKPLEPGDWDWVIENAADGDLKTTVALLMDMHNSGVDVPKSRLTSPQTQELENA